MIMDRYIKIMGIVNLTEDSFFAGSRCPEVEAALARIEAMLKEGADIIDIGACSTRPGSLPVGPETEWQRLKPVLEEMSRNFPDIPISIDTYWSEVVRRVHDLIGCHIVNDISAGEDDPMMLRTVGELGLEYVAMHKVGSHEYMHETTVRGNIVEEVRNYFDRFALRAEEAGIRKWVLDPGFGFAKDIGQNWELMAGLRHLKTAYNGFHPEILVGVSRKSMICKPLGISPEDSLSATQAAHMAALIKGADILRVHDVSAARQTVSLFRQMALGRE